jgi:hypothetical protein
LAQRELQGTKSVKTAQVTIDLVRINTILIELEMRQF